MKKALVIAVLGMFVVLGLGTAVIAQQSDSSSSAPSQSQAASPGDKSSSSTTNVEIKPGQRSDSGESAAASPRTIESRRIFGLEPTAAVLIAAAILVVVVLALVAMSRGSGETSSHTDIDFDRRR